MTTVVGFIYMAQKQVGYNAGLAAALGEMGDHQTVRNMPIFLQSGQCSLEGGLARLLQTPVTCEASDEDAGSRVSGGELHHGLQVRLADGLPRNDKCGESPRRLG